jgi:hypothetical protein
MDDIEFTIGNAGIIHDKKPSPAKKSEGNKDAGNPEEEFVRI